MRSPRLRFTVRRMMFAVAVVGCAGMGRIDDRAARVQQCAIRAIQCAGYRQMCFPGCTICYENDFIEGCRRQPSYRWWLAKRLGDDYFLNVLYVSMAGTPSTPDPLAPNEAFPRLECLLLYWCGTTDTDLVDLSGFDQLEQASDHRLARERRRPGPPCRTVGASAAQPDPMPDYRRRPKASYRSEGPRRAVYFPNSRYGRWRRRASEGHPFAENPVRSVRNQKRGKAAGSPTYRRPVSRDFQANLQEADFSGCRWRLQSPRPKHRRPATPQEARTHGANARIAHSSSSSR